MKTRFIAMVAAYFALVCSANSGPLATQKDAIAITKEDVIQVIETSFLEFFTNEDWMESSWKKGDILVVSPETPKLSPSAFFDSISMVLRKRNSRNLTKSVASELASLLKVEQKQKSVVTPNFDLTVATFDERIFVSKQSSQWFGRFPEKLPATVRGTPPKLKFHTRLLEIGFSGTGREAIVRTTVPSSHGASVAFFLRRSPFAWRVFHRDVVSCL